MAERRGRGQTRERILDAARRLFARDGYDATTVRAIAGDCGMTDAAIYHHFPSKRAIYDAVLVIPDAERRRLGPPVHDADELADEILDHFRVWSESTQTAAIMVGSALDGDQDMVALCRQLIQELREDVAAVLSDVDGAPSRMTSDALTLLVVGTSLSGIVRGDEYWSEALDDDTYRARIRKLVSLYVAPGVPKRRMADVS